MREQITSGPLELVLIEATLANLEAASAPPAPPPIAIERQGCGWFESSYELSIGLEVSELSDRCLFDLWLQLQPAGRRLH